MSEPLVRKVVEADQTASEEEILLVPTMGGTLPLYLFTETQGLPTLIVPTVNYDNNQHGPDENLRVGNLWYAIDLFSVLYLMQD